jgi:pyruvate carboxylase
VQRELSTRLRREATLDDVYSHLMYPDVFLKFAKIQAAYDDLSVLPTPAFFYGMKPGEEITVNLEPGKTLYIRLISVGPVDDEGKRVVAFELNGMPRQVVIEDKSVQPRVKSRPKADPHDPWQVGAPIPGVITTLPIRVGMTVRKGDRLLALEAMKMQTGVPAPQDAEVAEILVAPGDVVEAKDLLVRLRPVTSESPKRD